MAGISVRLHGLEETLRNIGVGGYLHRQVVTAGTRAMIENAEDLVGRAQRDAPVDEGTLRASGTTEVYVGGKLVARGGAEEATGAQTMIPEAVGGRDSIVAVVGFNTPYALEQHERLDYNHPKGGKAKYLEDNLKEQADRYSENFSDRVREALGR